MTVTGDAVDNISELAQRAVLPQAFHEPGSEASPDIVTTLTPESMTREIWDVRAFLEIGEPGPARKRGQVEVWRADSFAEYVNSQGEPSRTALYASDVDKLRVVGVLNGHRARAATVEVEGSQKVVAAIGSTDLVVEEAGWGDHVVTLQLQKTPEWKAWAENDGVQMGQEAMALFLEDHVLEVVEPSATEMSDIARTMDIKKDAQYHGGIRDASGQVNFRYDETIEGRAGASGDLAIPERIKLAIIPFVGDRPTEVWARFRHRLNAGKLLLSYKLERPDIAMRAAFAETVEAIEKATGLTAFHGTAPTSVGPAQPISR